MCWGVVIPLVGFLTSNVGKFGILVEQARTYNKNVGYTTITFLLVLFYL